MVYNAAHSQRGDQKNTKELRKYSVSSNDWTADGFRMMSTTGEGWLKPNNTQYGNFLPWWSYRTTDEGIAFDWHWEFSAWGGDGGNYDNQSKFLNSRISNPNSISADAGEGRMYFKIKGFTPNKTWKYWSNEFNWSNISSIDGVEEWENQLFLDFLTTDHGIQTYADLEEYFWSKEDLSFKDPRGSITGIPEGSTIEFAKDNIPVAKNSNIEAGKHTLQFKPDGTNKHVIGSYKVDVFIPYIDMTLESNGQNVWASEEPVTWETDITDNGIDIFTNSYSNISLANANDWVESINLGSGWDNGSNGIFNNGEDFIFERSSTELGLMNDYVTDKIQIKFREGETFSLNLNYQDRPSDIQVNATNSDGISNQRVNFIERNNKEQVDLIDTYTNRAEVSWNENTKSSPEVRILEEVNRNNKSMTLNPYEEKWQKASPLLPGDAVITSSNDEQVINVMNRFGNAQNYLINNAGANSTQTSNGTFGSLDYMGWDQTEEGLDFLIKAQTKGYSLKQLQTMSLTEIKETQRYLSSLVDLIEIDFDVIEIFEDMGQVVIPTTKFGDIKAQLETNIINHINEKNSLTLKSTDIEFSHNLSVGSTDIENLVTSVKSTTNGGTLNEKDLGAIRLDLKTAYDLSAVEIDAEAVKNEIGELERRNNTIGDIKLFYKKAIANSLNNQSKPNSVALKESDLELAFYSNVKKLTDDTKLIHVNPNNISIKILGNNNKTYGENKFNIKLNLFDKFVYDSFGNDAGEFNYSREIRQTESDLQQAIYDIENKALQSINTYLSSNKLAMYKEISRDDLVFTWQFDKNTILTNSPKATLTIESNSASQYFQLKKPITYLVNLNVVVSNTIMPIWLIVFIFIGFTLVGGVTTTFIYKKMKISKKNKLTYKMSMENGEK